MQEGAGKRERKERDTNTGVSGKGTLCPPQPWLWGWHQQGGLGSCPTPLSHPHHGMPEQGAAPKSSTQPGRGWPPLLRAAASGKQGCMLGNPGLASPAGAPGGSGRHPNRGMLNHRRAWIGQQVKWKHLPSMYVACRAGHPDKTRGVPQVWEAQGEEFCSN